MKAVDFKIRELYADDIFSMCDILGKCGFSELKKCFETADESENEYNAGIKVVLEMVGVICRNISSCKNEIYTFLADLCGVGAEDIASLKPAEFAKLIKLFLCKKEMTDFFTAVSEFFISD